MNEIFEKLRNQLAEVRNDESKLSRYAYSEKRDENGSYDENEIARYQLLLALQIDGNANDFQLIERLFQEEIQARKKDSFQGFTEALGLNAYLLACFNQIAHLSLFLQANAANFDTYFEFNEKFFLWNGIENSFQDVKNLGKDEQELFHKKVGETIEKCHFNDEDIDRWKAKLHKRYSPNITFDTMDEKLDFLLEIDEKETAKILYTQWKESQEKHNLSYFLEMKRYANWLNLIDDLIFASEKLLKFPQSDHDKLLSTIHLGDLYTRNNDFKSLKVCLNYYHEFASNPKKWIVAMVEIGIVHQHLEFILNSNDKNDEEAKEIWNWIEPKLKNLSRLNHLDLLAIANVYQLFGNKSESLKYHLKAGKAKEL